MCDMAKVTEQQALLKWCPEVRFSAYDRNAFDRILDGEPRLVGELAKVHFPRMARLAQHDDVRAGAEICFFRLVMMTA